MNYREKKKRQPNHNNLKPMGNSKSSSKKEVYSNTILPQETRNISNKQSDLIPKTTIKKDQKQKMQSWQKERTHKDQRRNEWNRSEENSKDQ